MDNQTDFLNGNGIIILLLFFLMLGGGWGNFGGNNASTQGALTRAELYDGLNTQDIKGTLSGINSSINTNADALTLALNSGFNNVNTGMTAGFNGVQMGLNNGFNSVNQSLNALGYQMSQNCCDLKTAMHAEGEATRALIQQNTIQDLRDAVANKDRELLATGLTAAQTVQTNNLENFIRTAINGCSCS